MNRLPEVSPELARLWRDHDVAGPEHLVKRMLHPVLGRVQLRSTNRWASV